jgi:hypothetical protein
MNFETCSEIEFAISRHFNYRTNVIIPNLSWGMFPYELDLCVLNMRSLYASEVEIKISQSDLKRDGKKHHQHAGKAFGNRTMIKALWFAMPLKMEKCTDLVPERAGILLVDNKGNVKILRKPTINKLARPWPITEAFKLARLGTLRMWSLKWNWYIRVENANLAESCPPVPAPDEKPVEAKKA